MVRTDLLRGRIAEVGTSQRQVARKLGMTEKTFYAKMGKGEARKSGNTFSVEEVHTMMQLLGIDDPRPIFFAEAQ